MQWHRRRFDHGILICSTGIGMSIVANKVPGVYAALCHDVFSAQRSRQHNNANVLCLGGSVIGLDLAKDIVHAYLGADFEGGKARAAFRESKGTGAAIASLTNIALRC